MQDLIRVGNWTVNAGLRWDHYQLLLNQQSLDPRFAVSYLFSPVNLVLHFSYDRVFQTPSFENILLSSSTAATGLNPIALQLPVQPSQGNYYEAGFTKVLFKKLKLDANYFRRDVSNYADDDQIDNTTISFPIAFQKAIIYGAEAKLDLPEAWNRFSGFFELFLRSGQRLVPRNGRPISGRRRHDTDQWPFPRFARSTQHISRPPPLSSHKPSLDRRRNSVRLRSPL